MQKVLNFHILSIFCINSLIVFSPNTFSKDSSEEELSLLIDSQRKMVSAQIDQKVHDFINDKNNTELLKTNEGGKLLSQHNKRLRLRAIENGFKKCKFENKEQERIASNLVAIASQLNIQSFNPCLFQKFKRVEEFTENALVERWVASMIQEAKTILLAIPSKLAPVMAGLEPAEVEDRLKEAIDGALAQLHLS